MDIVNLTVYDVYRRYRDFVDVDDLRSEAAVWWYGPGQKYLDAYLTEDENHVRLRRSIWRHCARWAEGEKATQSGYHPDDQLRYRTSEILAILPTALDPEGTPEGGSVREGPAAKGNLAEGGIMLAVLVDVRRALGHLDEDDLHFLELCEELRHDWDRVVTYMDADILPDTARRRHARIVLRMSRWLNNYYPYDEESVA